MHTRRRFARHMLCLPLAVQAVRAAPALAAESSFPERPVRIVTFIPAASGADATLRTMLVEVSRDAGAEFFVDNKPGGSGSVATSAVRNTAADGYTLLVGGSSVLISALLRARDQDPFAGFTPITMFLATRTALAVRSGLGANTLAELVQMARAKPGTISYATAGVGSYAHLMMELLARKAGVQFLHVPYPQMGNALTDAIGGRIDCVFSVLGTMQAQGEAGKVHFVGITGPARSPVAPDLPTFVEQGYPAMSVDAWKGLFAPVGTPQPVIDKVAAAFARAIKSPKVQASARLAGIDTAALGPAEFRALLDQETKYWPKVMDETGIRNA